MGTTGVDMERVAALAEKELELFVAERPLSMAMTERARRSMPLGFPTTWFELNYDHPPMWVAEGKGSRFRDVDGHEYIDFLLGIALTFCGHALDPVIRAIERRAAMGSMFQLPTEDSIWVAEELSKRYVPLRWQFALSSSQSILDCIRLSRALTGRRRILKFDANYHGHVDHLLVIAGEDGTPEPEYHGLDRSTFETTTLIQFNDIDALERELSRRDVAIVIAEPAMSNVGFIEPLPGFHHALRTLTRETGTMLLIDETQSFMCAYGGLTSSYALDPDLFVLGKSLGGGLVPVSVYGMTEETASLIEAPHDAYQVMGESVDEIALGGTMWGYSVGAAAARAVLEEVLTEEAFDRTVNLGDRLAEGMRRVIAAQGLDWSVQQLGTRAAYAMVPESPRDGRESREADVAGFRDAQRIFMANRGIWDAGWWMGPSLSIAHTAAEVDEYVGRFGEFLGAVT